VDKELVARQATRASLSWTWPPSGQRLSHIAAIRNGAESESGRGDEVFTTLLPLLLADTGRSISWKGALEADGVGDWLGVPDELAVAVPEQLGVPVPLGVELTVLVVDCDGEAVEEGVCDWLRVCVWLSVTVPELLRVPVLLGVGLPVLVAAWEVEAVGVAVTVWLCDCIWLGESVGLGEPLILTVWVLLCVSVWLGEAAWLSVPLCDWLVDSVWLWLADCIWDCVRLPDVDGEVVWDGEDVSETVWEGVLVGVWVGESTITGKNLLVPSVPSPSCPFLFQPQHHAAPPGEASAQVCMYPAAMAE
jgi:hypothetical protein